ncbi:MAG: Rieske (2Fe-2S) protein [Aureliella sp.]|jgi:nitrite reductase/ring-hydroxylating ferredoxin subunit
MLDNGPEASPPADARRWFLACKTSELAGGAREVLIAERVIAVFQTPSGIYAVDGMCAHQGGPLAKGSVDGCCVTCPWHGWQYDVTSGKNMLTGRQMLTTYAVEVRGDEAWVALPA